MEPLTAELRTFITDNFLFGDASDFNCQVTVA